MGHRHIFPFLFGFLGVLILAETQKGSHRGSGQVAEQQAGQEAAAGAQAWRERLARSLVGKRQVHFLMARKESTKRDRDERLQAAKEPRERRLFIVSLEAGTGEADLALWPLPPRLTECSGAVFSPFHTGRESVKRLE